MRKIFKFVLVVALMLTSGFSFAADKITIAAAANLRYVLEELKQQYLKENKGAEIEIVFGASGTLTQQIVNGANFDLFLAANTKFPEEVIAKGFGEGSSVVYCYGKVALWSMSIDVKKGIKATLSNPKVNRIAVANPKLAPYGKNAVETLQKLGLYETVEPKIVWGENINQTAQFVSTGNAQVGFVALSTILAPEMKGKQGKYYILKNEECQPIAQAGVVIKGKNTAAADKFFKYITSSKATTIWKKHGYEVK
jgi:molybdate ABC transporter, periplasmic molybdate-binding protein